MTTRRDIHRPESAAGLTIRRLGEDDVLAVRELADRDSVPVPQGELMGLEIEGRLLAMQPLADGEVIADPFARTAEVRALLELRTSQLRARSEKRAPLASRARAPHQPMHPLTLLTRGS